MVQWRTPSWQEIRDPLIVITCLILTIYEATAPHFHPELLIFFAGLIGAPAFIQRDEKRNKRRQNGEQNSSDQDDGSSPP